MKLDGLIGVKLRNAKLESMGSPRAAPRAGASPAPTIHDLRGPLRSIVGATLAVALEAG